MRKYTLEEWQAEGKRRFGGNFEDWKFICPACGRINTGREFKEAGAGPNAMYSTCIGRHNGKGVSGAKHKKGTPAPEHGCDWAAFGLFGTLNGGDIVVNDNDKETAVFSFAEMEMTQ
jgi:hypothetical protein